MKKGVILKKCPYCGSTDLGVKGRKAFEQYTACMYITCNNCKTDTWLFDTDDMSYPEALIKMAAKWNRRAA